MLKQKKNLRMHIEMQKKRNLRLPQRRVAKTKRIGRLARRNSVAKGSPSPIR